MGIENIIYLIIGVFVLILILKQMIGRKGEKICAICLSFMITWIVLLVLYYLGFYDNILLIGLLMGLTILGIYYTWERNVRKEKTLFRLPVLLTSVIIGYFLLTLENLLVEAGIIFVIWILFFGIYRYRNNARTKRFVDKIVECCKRW